MRARGEQKSSPPPESCIVRLEGTEGGSFLVTVLVLLSRFWMTLGSPFPFQASVSPWELGGRGVPQRTGEGRRRQGRGGSRTAHCGGPGPPEPLLAARGTPPPGRGSRRLQLAVPQLQPQHLPPPDGAGAARPCAPPTSGCSRGAGGGAGAEPEPSHCPNLARYGARRWAGPPLTQSPPGPRRRGLHLLCR